MASYRVSHSTSVQVYTLVPRVNKTLACTVTNSVRSHAKELVTVQVYIVFCKYFAVVHVCLWIKKEPCGY